MNGVIGCFSFQGLLLNPDFLHLALEMFGQLLKLLYDELFGHALELG